MAGLACWAPDLFSLLTISFCRPRLTSVGQRYLSTYFIFLQKEYYNEKNSRSIKGSMWHGYNTILLLLLVSRDIQLHPGSTKKITPDQKAKLDIAKILDQNDYERGTEPTIIFHVETVLFTSPATIRLVYNRPGPGSSSSSSRLPTINPTTRSGTGNSCSSPVTTKLDLEIGISVSITPTVRNYLINFQIDNKISLQPLKISNGASDTTTIMSYYSVGTPQCERRCLKLSKQ